VLYSVSKKTWKRLFGIFLWIVAMIAFFVPLLSFVFLFIVAMELLGFRFFTEKTMEILNRFSESSEETVTNVSARDVKKHQRRTERPKV
jgi:ABC-type Fe3+ transport system permease subunit